MKPSTTRIEEPGSMQVSLRLLSTAYRAAQSTPTFQEAGFRVFSQNDEDGILHLIFSIVETEGIAVEIGCGNGIQNNTANLIVNSGWHGLLIDANEAHVSTARRFYSESRDTKLFPPVVRRAMVTSDNVNEIVRGFKGEIDLLSLDIDSVDYWVLRELTVIRPRVIVAETPTIWGPEFARTVPNDSVWTRTADADFYGASLGAFDKLLGSRGYRFIGTSKYGTNSFFLATGIGDDAFPSVPLAEGFRHPRAKQGIETRSKRSEHLPWVDV